MKDVNFAAGDTVAIVQARGLLKKSPDKAVVKSIVETKRGIKVILENSREFDFEGGCWWNTRKDEHGSMRMEKWGHEHDVDVARNDCSSLIFELWNVDRNLVSHRYGDKIDFIALRDALKKAAKIAKVKPETD